jgi:hypothetical protein
MLPKVNIVDQFYKFPFTVDIFIDHDLSGKRCVLCVRPRPP